MDLKTRAILIVNLMTSQKPSDSRLEAIKANEKVLNDCMVVSSCFNCDNSLWSDDKNSVTCRKHNMTPPAWCIACGCKDFDYIPF